MFWCISLWPPNNLFSRGLAVFQEVHFCPLTCQKGGGFNDKSQLRLKLISLHLRVTFLSQTHTTQLGSVYEPQTYTRVTRVAQARSVTSCE